MLESLKKKALKKVMVSSIIMIVIGIVLLVLQGSQAFYAITGPRTFEDLAPDEIHNHMIVNVTLSGLISADYYSYEYQATSGGTSLGNTAYYYVIFTGDQSENIDRVFLGIKVPARYRKDIEELAEYFYENGWSPTPLKFKGEVRKMNGEELGYFKEFLGADDEQYEAFCLPYVIDTDRDLGSTAGMAYVLTLAGIVLLVIAIVRLIRAGTGICLKKLKADIADSGSTEASAESDYNTATSYLKNGEVRLGRLFTHYMSGSTPRLIPNTKLIWAYQTTTTHRRNGINVGTTYSVMMYVDDKRNSITLPMPNEAVTREMLQKINTTLPWVVVGYSDELKSMFNKNRAQFLDLRYNQVEHVAVEPGFEDMNRF